MVILKQQNANLAGVTQTLHAKLALVVVTMNAFRVLIPLH
jgi:hypothetical protein